ncbi:MAG: universal stress protein [Saprospiraceae bacterium]
MNILCPTDFSEVAGYALDAAIQLSTRLNATLHLFHCTGVPPQWETGEEESKELEAYKENLWLQAAEEIKKHSKYARKKGVSVEEHITHGDFLAQLAIVAKENQSDLVVMGSTGASGKREWFMGSNTQKAIRRLHLPVLVIKQPIENTVFPKAVFASGLLTEEQEVFTRFLQFSQLLGTQEVHILCIHTAGVFSPPRIVMQEALADFKALAADYDVSTHFYTDLSVEAGIRHFTEENTMNLIAISNHLRHPLKRIFNGNTVEMVVNHASIPVLSMDYEISKE